MTALLCQLDQAIITRVAQPLIDLLAVNPKELGRSLLLGCLASYLCGVFFESRQQPLDAGEIVKAGVMIVLTVVNLPLLSAMSPRATWFGVWRLVRTSCLFLAVCRLTAVAIAPASMMTVISAISLSLLVSALYAHACERPPPRKRRVPLWAPAEGAA